MSPALLDSGTTVVTHDPALEAETRTCTGQLRHSDLLALSASVLGSLALTSLVFSHLAPFSGALGFAIVAYLAFVGLYATVLSFDESGPVVRDRLASVAVHTLGGLLLAALVFVIGYTVYRGRSALPHLNFFTEDLSQAGPLEPLSVGGMAHAALGTLEQIAIALVVTVPLGLACALFLSEFPGAYARFVRTVVEAMTALPSIVAGLFIYATLILALGFDKSGFAAAMALSVMMLPIVIRAADVVLRLVPGALKEASLALGAGRWETVWRVVLPTSRSGLTTAVILGAARGIGETSPVLLTAGYTASFNPNPLHGPQVSLPLAIFEFVKSPQPTMIARGFGTAAALLCLVLVLFVLARIAGGRGPGVVTPRQAVRRAAQSAVDARRFASRRLPDDHVISLP